MTKNSDDKKIGKVKSTKQTTSVEGTEAVGGVSGVKATSAIGGVKRAGAVRTDRLPRSMTLEEREALFKMVNEEAEKLFSQGMSSTKKEVVASAVKMALDSSLLPLEKEEERGGNKK